MLDLPKRDRRAERREATRAEILAASWDLCRQEGLAALSLREVARRVGMQAPSLYSYFESKRAIYDAMFAQGCTEFAAADAPATPPVPDRDTERRQIALMLHRFVSFCVEDPVRYQLLFQRTIPGFEPSPEAYAISVGVLSRTARWFAAIGLPQPEVLDLFTAVGAGLAAQQTSNDPDGDRWLRLTDEAARMFHSHVRDRYGRQAPT